MNRTSSTRSASIGRPYLKPKEVTLTANPAFSSLPSNRRRSSARSWAVEVWVVSMTQSARARTGAIMARSFSTASARDVVSPLRGWRRRVSLYRLIMVSGEASKNSIRQAPSMLFSWSSTSNSSVKELAVRTSYTRATRSYRPFPPAQNSANFKIMAAGILSTI